MLLFNWQVTFLLGEAESNKLCTACGDLNSVNYPTQTQPPPATHTQVLHQSHAPRGVCLHV